MLDPNPIEDRDALYYPFIHFRNELWLRNALLFFPHVLRMTPGDYALNDAPFIHELAATKGRRGEPLVGSYPLNSYEAYQAGKRLAHRLEPDLAEPVFRATYDRAATVNEFKDDGRFQIHRDKFAFSLLDSLQKAGLAWAPPDPHRGDWVAVHPVIGEIIMSTAAATVAQSRGLDIITDSDRNHIIAASRDEETIYNTLLRRTEEGAAERKPTVAEIGDLVIATTFDLSSLKPADFAALAQERDALFDLRKLLAQSAAEIPAMSDRATRDGRAREAAEHIIQQWEAKRRTWGHFLKRLFRVDAAAEAKDMAKDLLKLALPATGGAGLGAASVAAVGAAGAGSILLGSAPGLAVGISYYAIKTWADMGAEEKAAPTRFLSAVAEKGGILAAAASPSPV